MAGSLQTLKDSLTRSESDLRAKDGEIRFVQQQLNEAEKKLCISDANMAVLQKVGLNCMFSARKKSFTPLEAVLILQSRYIYIFSI